jgi:DUF4097 and DUF4098 domain-containing protein YvlB
MRRFWIPAIALLLGSLPVFAAEATFQRTLSVNGPVDLTISDGAGEIHITRGSDNQIHIFGRVHSGWGASASRVSEIAANPPIEQTGNIVRIGGHHFDLHNISIDYEIQAPAGSHLEASTGSGNLKIEGVGHDAHLSTGSGDIRAEGLQGAFSVGTGSGNVVVEQVTAGDAKAETGSGDIELRGVHGGLRASTGSGTIRVTGTPTSNWRLATGSGSIDFTPGTAGFLLDASSGSGAIHSDHEMAVQGTMDRHHVVAKVGGGGPTVRIETGSGDIRIH